MNEHYTSALTRSPQLTASVALKTFFNIMRKWKVSTDKQIILLGDPTHVTFNKWKKGKVAAIPRDTLERISCVLGIYRGLGELFPNRLRADAWVQKPNRDFCHESALDYMCKGGMVHLLAMRRYVDTQSVSINGHSREQGPVL